MVTMVLEVSGQRTHGGEEVNLRARRWTGSLSLKAFRAVPKRVSVSRPD